MASDDLTKRFRRATAAALALVLPGVMTAPFVAAQSVPVQFEAVSVEPGSNLNDQPVRITSFRPERFAAANIQLRFPIQMAFRIRDFQVTEGPRWIESERYDIEATRSTGASRDQMFDMLQSLLRDRFKLRTHAETRVLPVYALVVARGGSMLKPGGGEACLDPSTPGPPPAPGSSPQVPGGGIYAARTAVIGSRITIAQLLRPLGDSLHREVIDKTGLSGTYDVRLEWAADPPQQRGLAAGPDAQFLSAPDPSGLAITMALREQPGLSLVAERGPVRVIVVDSINKPDAN